MQHDISKSAASSKRFRCLICCTFMIFLLYLFDLYDHKTRRVLETDVCSSKPPNGLILWNVRSKVTAGWFLLTGFIVFPIDHDPVDLLVVPLHHLCQQRKMGFQIGPFKCFRNTAVITDKTNMNMSHRLNWKYQCSFPAKIIKKSTGFPILPNMQSIRNVNQNCPF